MLTAQQYDELQAELSDYASDKRVVVDLLKSELRAAIEATDQWIEDNQASFNNALPSPSKQNLTADQKVLLFFFVANKRFDVL